MSQRDVIVFFSKQLNACYVTTNKGYMNKSKSELVAMFKSKDGSKDDGNNANFEDRPGLISVVDIGLAADFDVEITKEAGEAKSEELEVAKAAVMQEYAQKGFTSTNGVRR
ncbi:hypothetical protein [Vibrio maerlii]|uniref:hypothetical protein n=1 Tax=Vibrio maerlii TaxID=2231648 RepID=UPI000E3D959F|nr:hypothetical protein [Vibrio maerlii]